MSEVEKKALALLIECGWGGAHLKRAWNPRYEALCRAIEQHEAFQQEVSDEIMRRWPHGRAPDGFGRFIIPKPDPLAEAWIEATGSTVGMGPLEEALAKRGGKIVWDITP